MSHFYGVLKGSRGEATRCATKSSGISTTTAGWQGAINVQVWHSAGGRDMYRISLEPWQGSGGHSRLLAAGVLNATIADIDKE